MTAYDAVLFDFDGVLADTEPVHYACWRDILSACGVVLEWSVYQRECIGVSDVEMLGFLASLVVPPLRKDAMLACYARKQEVYRRMTADGTAIPAEIRSMLRSLEGWRLAVVSSSATADVEPALAAAGLRQLFGALVCRENVLRCKPAPDPYLQAARLLGASRPLVVEDSEAGVASARAAGFDVIAVDAIGAVPALVARALGR